MLSSLRVHKALTGVRPRSAVALSRTQCSAVAPPSAGSNTQKSTEYQVGGVKLAEFPSSASGRFVNNYTHFREEFSVRGYEVAPNQQASMSTIANLLQESAGNHAVGLWGRAEKGFAGLPDSNGDPSPIVFVMTRLQIRMDSYPKWGDILRVETCFCEESRLAARRDWDVVNVTTGQKIGAATSTWVNINMDTRKLTKLPEDVKSALRPFAADASKCCLPAAECKRKLPELAEDVAVPGPQQIARRSDTDMNGHINNVVYLAWALESVPEEVCDEYHLYELELDFKAECHAGETISSALVKLSAKEIDGRGALGFLHTLKRTDANGKVQELVRARTTWKQHSSK